MLSLLCCLCHRHTLVTAAITNAVSATVTLLSLLLSPLLPTLPSHCWYCCYHHCCLCHCHTVVTPAVTIAVTAAIVCSAAVIPRNHLCYFITRMSPPNHRCCHLTLSSSDSDWHNQGSKVSSVWNFSPHLPPVSLTPVAPVLVAKFAAGELLIPVVHFDLRISPRIFEKIRNYPNVVSGPWWNMIHGKNLKQKISIHCPFINCWIICYICVRNFWTRAIFAIFFIYVFLYSCTRHYVMYFSTEGPPTRYPPPPPPQAA